MSIEISGWLSNLRASVSESSGLKYPLLRAARDGFNGIWQTATSRWPPGTNVMDREWDALVILDACRVDALRSVVEEFDQLSQYEVRAITSTGTGTVAWTSKTFTNRYERAIGDTAYLSANVYTRSVLEQNERPPSDPAPVCFPNWRTVSAEAFQYVEYAFESGWSERLDVTPPWYVTDRAIDIGRSRNSDRLIVHYTQPHIPYIAEAHREGRELTDFEKDPWTHIIDGDRTWEEAWELYLQNLRLVLDSVMTFLANFDGSVVITADHGELFGEWGAYSHPEGFPHQDLLTVPWMRVRASDRETHHPSADPGETVDISTAEQLAALGYT